MMRRNWLRPLLPVICVAFLTPFASAGEARKSPDADAALLKTATRLYEGIRTETLPNGLRVYLKPIAGAPTVTTMVAYKVGSADEDLGVTGLSHYLEHLMFKGTAKLVPGDIDRMTQRNGGKNNAYTSEDMTVYYFDFAADRWTQALEVEADRMRNLLIDAKHEFEQEKGAVIAELEQGEDLPWEVERKAVLPLLFGEKSPYGHPVIGQREHVRNATAEIIKRYYDTWYHPNNASIVIVGGFDADDALALIKRLFGSIPKAELPERKPAPVLKPRTEVVRRKLDSKFEQPRITLAFNTVPAQHEDAYALDVLQNLIATGKTSRLYQKLVEGDRSASSVSAYHTSGRYPGWFTIEIESLKKDLAALEKTVIEELARIAEKGVSEEEWRRVRRGIIATFIFGHEDIHELADTIAMGVTTVDLDYVKEYLPRLAAVTPEELKRAARKYFIDAKPVVIWARPGEAEQKRGAHQKELRSGARDAKKNAPVAAAFSLKNAQSVKLPNGLTLLLMENHNLPIVVAEAYVRGVQMREPAEKAGVAALIGDMLSEGTATRTGKQISRLIEDAGGVFTTDSAGGTIKVLAPDTELGLDLLFDSLMHPAFPAEELEKRRELLITQIEDAEGAPRSRAELLLNKLVYGKHPLGRPPLGRKNVVEKLSAADCREFHQAVFRPNNTLVAIVGDFDSKKVIDGIGRRTAKWPRAELAPLPVVELKKPKKVLQRIETDDEAAQLHIYIGHAGVRRNDPDYHTLLVMDNVLGVGPGFTDRLSASLRDRQGLAYTVRATIADSAEEEVGMFVGYVGTFPDKFEVVKQSLFKEIRRIRDEPPTKDEVENAKAYLLGNVAFRFTTNEEVAGELLRIERFGLGFDYLEKFRSAIEAVTPTAVQAAAKKHIDPDKLILVAVGPVDADGKPLKKDR